MGNQLVPLLELGLVTYYKANWKGRDCFNRWCLRQVTTIVWLLRGFIYQEGINYCLICRGIPGWMVGVHLPEKQSNGSLFCDLLAHVTATYSRVQPWYSIVCLSMVCVCARATKNIFRQQQSLWTSLCEACFDNLFPGTLDIIDVQQLCYCFQLGNAMSRRYRCSVMARPPRLIIDSLCVDFQFSQFLQVAPAAGRHWRWWFGNGRAGHSGVALLTIGTMTITYNNQIEAIIMLIMVN